MDALLSPKAIACLRPTFMAGISGYIKSYEDLEKIRDILTIEEEDATRIAFERLKSIGVQIDEASLDEVRLWFLSYQFVFAKIHEVDHFEPSLKEKMAAIDLVASRAHEMALSYFSEMRTKFAGCMENITQLFDYRRKPINFMVYCMEEVARERTYCLMSEDVINAPKRRTGPLKFSFA